MSDDRTTWRLRLPKTVLSNLPGCKAGGRWWKAYSKKSVKDILRFFREQRVGAVLYETIGGVAETSEVCDDTKVIRIQVRFPKNKVEHWAVGICLSEVGIGLIDRV